MSKSIINKLNKIEKLINISAKQQQNFNTLLVIDPPNNKYFIIDNAGNKIPITEQEYNKTFYDSKGRFIQPKEINVILDDEI